MTLTKFNATLFRSNVEKELTKAAIMLSFNSSNDKEYQHLSCSIDDEKLYVSMVTSNDS